jgi:hypothetical protein
MCDRHSSEQVENSAVTQPSDAVIDESKLVLVVETQRRKQHGVVRWIWQ